MKRFMEDYIFLILFVAYLLYSIFFSAHQVIFGILGALTGWKMWLNHVQKPDYNRDLDARVIKAEELIKGLSEGHYNERLLNLESKISVLALGFSRPQTPTEEMKGFSWHGKRER